MFSSSVVVPHYPENKESWLPGIRLLDTGLPAGSLGITLLGSEMLPYQFSEERMVRLW